MRRLYIDLDCLLDTRLGLLSQLDEEAARQVVSESSYWLRERTCWETLTKGRVSNERFQKAWETRTHEVLPASVMTAILLPLSSILTGYQQNVLSGIVDEDIGLEINTAPYELTDEERDEIAMVVRERLYPGLDVSFCERPMDNLSPIVLVQHYAGAILYDFIPWMKRYAWDFPKIRCTDFSLIVPRLFEKDASHLSLEDKKYQFLEFTLMVRPHLSLEFIEPRWFSLFKPDEFKDAPQ